MSDTTNNIKNIKVMLAGRSFPLKVEAHKEAAIQKVVKDLNTKINKFQIDYTSANKEDILSMVLLTYAVELQELSSGQSDLSAFNDDLTEVDEILEAAI
jgi:cell division protein ZapA (FtsZ GTPase activity inhibitor)